LEEQQNQEPETSLLVKLLKQTLFFVPSIISENAQFTVLKLRITLHWVFQKNKVSLFYFIEGSSYFFNE